MNYGGYFDSESKLNRIHELEEIMQEEDFWSNKRKSERIIAEVNEIKDLLESASSIREKVKNNIDMLLELKNNEDSDFLFLLESEYSKLHESFISLQTQLFLNQPYDKFGAIVEIHSGAGGTEACDWADMLFRMYNNYCRKKGYKIEVLDSLPGDEVGIKSLTMIVKGINAFGYLKCEKGVHRLVRISPFDSNARRHTSFASVLVTPLFENTDVTVKIDPNDIRVDVYRSSGCGGQGVNTTDSAVRITHLPTKIVVTCQNERSQILNKERAMEVLKNKLYQLEIEKRNNEINILKGSNMDINFGSQIRSYVMCPYTLVKDHRTNAEESDVEKVLDGEIDYFITEILKSNKIK